MTMNLALTSWQISLFITWTLYQRTLIDCIVSQSLMRYLLDMIGSREYEKTSGMISETNSSLYGILNTESKNLSEWQVRMLVWLSFRPKLENGILLLSSTN